MSVTQLRVGQKQTVIGMPGLQIYPKGGSAAIPILISDTFTDTTGVHIHDHTISPINTPAASWVEVVGTETYCVIQSNRMGLLWTGIYAEPYLDCGVSDFVINCDAHLDGTAAWSMVHPRFRYTDDLNYWYIDLTIGTAASVYALIECKLGISVTRATGTIPTGVAVTYAVEITCDGTTITCTLDGANTLTYNSATFNQTVTNVGFMLYQQSVHTNLWVDDYKITAV